MQRSSQVSQSARNTKGLGVGGYRPRSRTAREISPVTLHTILTRGPRIRDPGTMGGRFTGMGMRGFPGVGIDEGERKVPRWVYRWQVKPPDKSHLG